MRIGSAFLFIAVTCLAAPAALAQQPVDSADQRARALYNAGVTYLETGEYEQALRMFQDAYNLSHRGALQYNIGLVYERLNDLPHAIEAFQSYLRDGAPEADRPTMEMRVQNLQRRLEAQQASTQTQAQAQTQTQTQTQAPSTGPAPATPPSGGGIPTGALVSYIAGGVGLVGYAIFGILTLSEDSRLTDACGSPPMCVEDDLGKLHTMALLSDISLAVGIVGAALGTVLLVTAGGGSSEETSASIAPYLGPNGGGATARVTF